VTWPQEGASPQRYLRPLCGPSPGRERPGVARYQRLVLGAREVRGLVRVLAEEEGAASAWRGPWLIAEHIARASPGAWVDYESSELCETSRRSLPDDDTRVRSGQVAESLLVEEAHDDGHTHVVVLLAGEQLRDKSTVRDARNPGPLVLRPREMRNISRLGSSASVAPDPTRPAVPRRRHRPPRTGPSPRPAHWHAAANAYRSIGGQTRSSPR
jgi:hypothetical protein